MAITCDNLASYLHILQEDPLNLGSDEAADPVVELLLHEDVRGVVGGPGLGEHPLALLPAGHPHALQLLAVVDEECVAEHGASGSLHRTLGCPAPLRWINKLSAPGPGLWLASPHRSPHNLTDQIIVPH